MPGFELRPQALISGEAFVGVRRFATLSDQAPDYTGIVAAVKTAYTVAGHQVRRAGRRATSAIPTRSSSRTTRSRTSVSK